MLKLSSNNLYIFDILFLLYNAIQLFLSFDILEYCRYIVIEPQGQ